VIARSAIRMRFVALIAGLLGGLLIQTAPAQALSPGDTVRDVLTVSGKDVPLPEGTFTVLETGMADITQPAYGAQVNPDDYGPVRRILLARIAGGTVTTTVEVVANTLANPDGWGTSSQCSRSDIYATLVRYQSGWDVSCMWIRPYGSAFEDEGESGAMVRGFAHQQTANISPVWIESGFRVANRHDLIDVRYRFAALENGAPVDPAETGVWSPAEIADNPGPLARVQQVAVWAGALYPVIESGLREPIARGAVFAGPFDTDSAGVTDREVRLSKLASLLSAGVISQADYDRQAAIIAAEAEPTMENAWTYATVAGYKAFTYRVAVTIINAGIDYVFIGTPFAAGVLVILQVVVNTTKFFFHEVMWQELFGVGPLQRDAPRVMDFVSASAPVR